MSDKAESHKALSFEEIMQSVEAKKEEKPAARPPPAPRKPEVVKKSSQPSFEDILSSAQPSKDSDDRSQPERKARPPRPPREERKMPIVTRKPALGAPSEPPPAEGSAQAGQEAASQEPSTDGPGEQSGQPQGAQDSGQPRREPRPPRPPRAPQPERVVAESVYAQPGTDEGGDFGALFAEQEKAPKREKLKPGSKITARIAHLGSEVAFLDLGGKGEGIIDLRELRNDKGELVLHQGDSIEGYVLSLTDGVVITRSVPKGSGREVIQQAFDSKIAVEGTVTAVNKGGLEVDLGGTRAFVPASQIDIRFVDDTSVFVGQKLKFRVTELRGGNAILSRRALLEEERAGKAQELRRSLEVGAQLDGVITSVRDFGAFVDLGGLEGLIHVSELSHTRVAHAQDAVKPNQKVRVQVLRIEKDEKGVERIALSLRALEQDPWDAMRGQLEEGKKLQGKVVRLQPFGAFVELFPGIDGLVHVSALADRHVAHPREVVQEGEMIWVQIESVDDDQRRVALRKITEEEAQGEGKVPAHKERAPRGEKPASAGAAGPAGAAGAKRLKVGDMVDATVDKVEAFGVFIRWEGGKGLIPNAELGTERGTDNKRTHPPGMTFKAQIIEIDERGRYRLSRTSAERAADRADYQDYQKKSSKMAPGRGFGTLGDLLRAKLAPPAEDDEGA